MRCDLTDTDKPTTVTLLCMCTELMTDVVSRQHLMSSSTNFTDYKGDWDIKTLSKTQEVTQDCSHSKVSYHVCHRMIVLQYSRKASRRARSWKSPVSRQHHITSSTNLTTVTIVITDHCRCRYSLEPSRN